MEKLSQRVARSLAENGNIRKEHEAVYQYAFQSVLILGTNVLLSLFVGILLDRVGYCVLFLCAMIPLRSNAGGFHASNLAVCYILSFISLITTLLLAGKADSYPVLIMAAAALASTVLIFIYAPLDTKNRRLDDEEKKRIGRKARWIVSTEFMLGFFFLTVNPSASCMVWGAVLWCALGYIAWFIEQKAGVGGENEKE
ncbi:MAG: accessory gene regulator B family protein [Butyrivibrio sp.]|nr:accessory gene regulator B family protein [Butyrivibrio sp.]